MKLYTSIYMRKAQENFAVTWETTIRLSLRRACFSYMAVRVGHVTDQKCFK